MKKLILLLFLLHGLFSENIFSQGEEQLREINDQVWQKFIVAFNTGDFSIMKEIHSKEVIRIPANRKEILDYKAYMALYDKKNETSAEKSSKNHFELRFFERINNGVISSERGIYKLTVDKGLPGERVHYGKFFVILKKENGKWKITLDYDSNENKTIGGDDFNAAFPMNAFDKFQ